ncbi:hypothetical protein MY9_0597 [Bacillus sp. JS]|nr:hypothetical protein MY9_0597 [Bacillus sp. JS]
MIRIHKELQYASSQPFQKIESLSWTLFFTHHFVFAFIS